MPTYQQKKTSVIVRDSTGNLVQIMPETEAGNVLYKDTTASAALKILEDKDVEQGFSEIESQVISATVQKTTRHIIRSSGLNPRLFFGYSYEQDGATAYAFDDKSGSESFIEGGVEWSTEFELDDSSKSYQAISFGISGSEIDIDNSGAETVINPFIGYGIFSDANEAGYAPWRERDEFIAVNLPAEGETKSWLCNTMLDTESQISSIPSEERNMTLSLTGLGNSRYRASFLWNKPSETVEVQETRTLKNLKTSLVRADESVTAISKPMTGLVQNVAGEAESRIVYTKAYPVDDYPLDCWLIIGDSEGTDDNRIPEGPIIHPTEPQIG